MKRIASICTILLTVSLCFNALCDYATLQYKDSGAQVLLLQQALTAIGYSTGGTDGKYGAATENAVRKFQKEHGLKVDGKAGNATQTLLYQLADNSSSNSSTANTSASSTTAGSTSSSGYFGGNYTKLQYGASGTRVELLQKALKTLGYYSGVLDSKFGNGTQKAVVAFQSAKKLTADGVAGKNTLRAIETALNSSSGTAQTTSPATTAAPTATPTASQTGTVIPSRTLRKGCTGNDVKSLQTRLKELGYYKGTIDSSFGSGTLTAVKAFQSANRLTADGIAGSATLKLLFSTGAASATSSTAASTPTPTVAPAATAQTTPAPESTVPTRTLRKGDTGNDVKSLQSRLKELGYYTGTLDSSFGNGTYLALKSFQSANGLKADGVAGNQTYAKLFSANAVSASDAPSSTAVTASSTVTCPPTSQIKLLHWFKTVKPSIKTGQTIVVYEPVSKLSWTLRLYSLGRHADSEPLTAQDTANMLKAFGGENTWNQKAVYVRLPDGQWTLASTHDMPHLSGSISSNNFNGHLCVHFLRDMDECTANDPSYGVSNQNTIRSAWKKLTGETVN